MQTLVDYACVYVCYCCGLLFGLRFLQWCFLWSVAMHFKRMFFQYLPIGFRLLIEKFSKELMMMRSAPELIAHDHKIVIYNRKCYYSKNVSTM